MNKVLKEIKQLETIRFYTRATPTFLLLGNILLKVLGEFFSLNVSLLKEFISDMELWEEKSDRSG